MSAPTTGLIGWPVAHSLSPIIHRHWRAQHNIAGDYELLPIDPADMETGLRRLKIRGLKGFNVTVPHKETIIPFLDTVDDLAHHIGAVNTVVRDGSTWRGTNTDAYGFMAHLKASAPNADLSRVVVLGAGGAARAAIVALKEAGAGDILLLNRTAATAAGLAAEFGVKAGEWDARDDALDGATLLVNSTSLGMQGKPALEISLKKMAANAAIYDVVYAPLETPLLAAARSQRLLAIDGLGMLLYQAQRAFEEWHGVRPQIDAALRAAVQDELNRRSAA